MATGWTVRGSNPGWGEVSHTCPDRPSDPPSLLYNRYRVFPGVKSGRSVRLTPHPPLVPRSRKSRAISLLPLWVVRLCTEPQCLYKGALYLYLNASHYTPKLDHMSLFLPSRSRWYDKKGKVKISPLPGFDPRTVQPVASRYTDYTARPTKRYNSNV